MFGGGAAGPSQQAPPGTKSAMRKPPTLETIEYSNGDKFEGYKINDLYEGEGKYIYSRDNSSYVGQYVKGKRHGFGTFNYASGNVYEGQWIEDKCEGEGTFRWSSGNVYNGQFFGGQRVGQGTTTFADGGEYIGEYRNGKRDGVGRFVYANGNAYDGQWRADKSHGEGKFFYADGSVYDGQFLDGRRSGQGATTFADGTVHQYDANSIGEAEAAVKGGESRMVGAVMSCCGLMTVLSYVSCGVRCCRGRKGGAATEAAEKKGQADLAELNKRVSEMTEANQKGMAFA